MKKRKPRSKGTPLSRRKVEKGRIPSEWNALKAVAPMADVSWYHDFLPDYLWLVLTLHQVERRRVFSAFRRTFDGLEKIKKPDRAEAISHQGLATLSDLEFSHVVDPFLSDLSIRASLRSLLLFDDLPGLDRWKTKLTAPTETNFDIIESAVRDAGAQDSRIATDIAFMNFMCLVAQDKFRVNPGLMDLDEINTYATDPDAAPKLAGMVRAMRNGWAIHNRAEAGHSREWTDKFYEIGRRRTQCKGFYPTQPDNNEEADSKVESIAAIIESIRHECAERLTIKFQQNGFDERVEVLAALGLYGCDVAISAIASSDTAYAQGAILLRSLAEINITISYILNSSDGAERYRSYGAGRASLLHKKSEETGTSAHYLFLPELKAVANERKADVFVDMPLTSFYEKSIRETAIAHGAKEVYDNYYDVGSMYGHAEWGGVSTSSVQMCMNPLHLGHYIPSFRMFTAEMLNDVEWLLNRISSELRIGSQTNEE